MIASLTGRADDHELIFTRDADGLWRASVPPDLTDGQYVVTLCAVTAAGEASTYRGVCYMSGGVCRIVLDRVRYQVSLLPEAAGLVMLPQRIQILMGRCRAGGTRIPAWRGKMAGV